MEKTQSQYSKEYIIEALFTLMKKQTFLDISVADICKKAGVSRATYYRYFKTKKDVIMKFFQGKVEDYLLSLRKYEKLTYRNITYEFFKHFKESENELKILRQNYLLYLYMEMVSTTISNFFAEKFDNEKLEMSYVYSGAIYSYSIWWLNNDFKKDITDVVNDFLSCFTISNKE